MGRAGLEFPPSFIRHGPHLRSAGRQMAMELMAQPDPPTGIVAASDLQAIGVLEAAQATGRQVPGQLSVIGFDDIEVASYVRLSTIRQSLELSGQRAAELLLGVMGAEERPEPLHEVLQLELVVRNTTGVPQR
jgi:LacI family transcriptional regulator